VPILLLDEFGSNVLWRTLTAVAGLGPVHVLSSGRVRRIALSRSCASLRVIDRRASDERKLRTIETALAATGARVLLPVMDWDCRLVVRHRDRLARSARLPWLPTLAALDTVRDKVHLAAFLEAHDLPRVPTLEPATSANLESLPMPVLWKPAGGGNGHGIRRFDERAPLHRFLERRGPDDRGVVQAFVAGEDHDVSVLCCDGEVVAWTSQRGERAPGAPYRYGDPVHVGGDPQALDAVRELLRVLRWSGIAHIDLRRDAAGRFLPVDFSPRIWATVLASVAAGVNLPRLWAGSAVGSPIVAAVPRRLTYHSVGSAVTQVAEGLRRGRRPSFRLGDSELGFVLRDPLPRTIGILAHAGNRIRGRLRATGTRGISRGRRCLSDRDVR
jgi:predicted ATP-grasp superfamily ATP-dependent carboligase